MRFEGWKSEIYVVPREAVREELFRSPLLRELVGDPWSGGLCLVFMRPVPAYIRIPPYGNMDTSPINLGVEQLYLQRPHTQTRPHPRVRGLRTNVWTRDGVQSSVRGASHPVSWGPGVPWGMEGTSGQGLSGAVGLVTGGGGVRPSLARSSPELARKPCPHGPERPHGRQVGGREQGPLPLTFPAVTAALLRRLPGSGGAHPEPGAQ